MKQIEVPILIVGGGVVGLTASMLLRRLGVESLLVTYYPGTSPQPKAHILNQRTMEIFEEIGVAQAVYEAATPPRQHAYAGWYAGVAGPSPWHGREIGRVEAWGVGYGDPDYIAASACRPANLPQMNLEPILKAHAEQASPGQVRFHHELLDFEQDRDGVTSRVLNRDTGETFLVRSKYLFAADAGKTVGPRLGIEMSGKRNLMRMVSVHFAADLSRYLTGPEVLTRFLINPDFGGSWASGVLLPEGPTRWGPDSEEWVYHARYTVDDEQGINHDKVLERMHAVLGIPDLRPQVIHISGWVMEGVVADRYRDGRILLLGDSCKRHPPTGGLGLNSGVQDAYNLCWKVAAVLSGRAGDALLDTYEAERRPVALRNVELAISNAMHHFVIDQALGLSDEATPQENWARLRPLWEDGPGASEVREKVARAIAAQRIGFRHHNVEFGYAYEDGALVPDGSAAPQPLDPVMLYEPGTRPGQPLPHALVQRAGAPVPLGSFAQDGRFVLIAGEDGQDWVQAARELAERLGVPLHAFSLGLREGDWLDTRGAWARHRGIGRRGALLVRPDRYVVFRAQDGVADPRATLGRVFEQVLAR